MYLTINAGIQDRAAGDQQCPENGVCRSLSSVRQHPSLCPDCPGTGRFCESFRDGGWRDAPEGHGRACPGDRAADGNVSEDVRGGYQRSIFAIIRSPRCKRPRPRHISKRLSHHDARSALFVDVLTGITKPVTC